MLKTCKASCVTCLTKRTWGILPCHLTYFSLKIPLQVLQSVHDNVLIIHSFNFRFQLNFIKLRDYRDFVCPLHDVEICCSENHISVSCVYACACAYGKDKWMFSLSILVMSKGRALRFSPTMWCPPPHPPVVTWRWVWRYCTGEMLRNDVYCFERYTKITFLWRSGYWYRYWNRRDIFPYISVWGNKDRLSGCHFRHLAVLISVRLYFLLDTLSAFRTDRSGIDFI